MTWFTENLWESIAILGLVALCIEVVVLGFSTFILFFLGLSCLISALAMYLGIVNESWTVALTFNAVTTILLAVVLWKPLERMQNSQSSKQVKSDFAEIEFVLDKDIDDKISTAHAYSGITWQVKSHSQLKCGQRVKVVNKEVGVLWVEASE